VTFPIRQQSAGSNAMVAQVEWETALQHNGGGVEAIAMQQAKSSREGSI